MIIYVHVRITFYKTIKKTPAVPGVPDPFTNLSFISLFSHFRWSLLSSVTSDQPETQTHINLIQKILHVSSLSTFCDILHESVSIGSIFEVRPEI